MRCGKLALTVIAIFSALAALPAVALATPKLTITFQSPSKVTVTPSDFTGTVSCTLGAPLAGGCQEPDCIRFDATSRARVFDLQSAPKDVALASRIIAADGTSCSNGEKLVVSGWSLDLEGGIEPDPNLLSVLLWSGWSAELTPFAEAVLTGFDSGECKLNGPPSATFPSCRGSYAKDAAGVIQLAVTYSGGLGNANGVRLSTGSGDKKKVITAAIRRCPFNTIGRIHWLFPGATRETIKIDSSVAGCTKRFVGQSSLRLESGDTQLLADAIDGAHLFELEHIPENLEKGSKTWEVRSASGGLLGMLDLPVAGPAVTASPELGVWYGVESTGAGELNAWHTQRSADGNAVTTGARGTYEQYVQNTSTLTVARELEGVALSLLRDSSKYESPDAKPDVAKAEFLKCAARGQVKPRTPSNACDALEEKVEACGKESIVLQSDEDHWVEDCRAHRRPWRVVPLNWTEDVWLSESPWWYGDEPAHFARLHDLTFAVLGEHTTPFEVAVQLVTFEGEEERVLLETKVPIAKAARSESLPLPIASALYVICGNGGYSPSLTHADPPSGRYGDFDVIRNGETRAVDDEDVETGDCKLNYSPQAILARLEVDDWERGIDLLKYYGRQNLSVTVKRAGATDQTITWSLDPTRASSVRLPVLTDVKNATGVYTVTAALRGPVPPAAIYRPAANSSDGSSNRATNAAPSLGDLEFTGNLRPRGPFGWRSAPIRVFLTFPVNFTGIRFPANPRELDSSSSSTHAQVTPVQVGTLVALEPWNYDTGHNLWAVPARFVTGFHLFNLTEAAFAPTWVSGVIVALPVVDLPKGAAKDQLGTDVALGMLWEVDLKERDVWTRGQHFLLTLGLNVLSLFGTK